jgi:ATP-dependent Lon protease
VDKLGRDFRGDPASALLEILDPAQNHQFRDNYLDLPFDLSKVFFICTANSLDPIPRPLLDRMEVLRLSGYSEEEKVIIAQRYLMPRQKEQTGLKPEQLDVPEPTLRQVINRYTREAGVRGLERAIGQVARKAARRFAEGRTEPVTVGPEDLFELLGRERFRPERGRISLQPGVSTGMAWTEAGGDVLYIESSLLRGGKGLRLTGQLGDVMRESARTALSYVWSHAEALGIEPSMFRKAGVHVHVPAGAVPKDGPSAGVAMVTALASLFTEVPVRSDTAMTGEVTLSGLVLPVGGIKEKVLAARRAGIKQVILPRDNETDLKDLPDDVRQSLRFVLVDRVEEALAAGIPSLADRLHATAA